MPNDCTDMPEMVLCDEQSRSNAESNTNYKSKTIMSKGTKTVFPKSTKVKLVYCDDYTVSTSSTVQAEAYFRANGPYDPDASIGGHQPLGFDQWAAFYNHYVVEKATIEVEAKESPISSDVLLQLAVMLSDDTTIPGSPSALREQPLTNCQIFAKSCGSKSLASVKHLFVARDFFNRKDIMDNQAEIGALVSANPTEQAYFCVVVGKSDGTASSLDFEIRVRLVYDVIFSEPKALAQS
jgi:hypothetical protein